MIRLQFIESNGMGSELIRLFSHGWPTHVDLVLPDETLLGARSDVVGGKPAGVQIRPPDYEPFLQVKRINLDASPQQEKAFYDYAQLQIGKPYDKLAIAAFAIGRNWRDDSAWYCSELGAACSEQSLVLPRPLAQGISQITPRDLLLVLSPWDVTP